MAEGEPLSEGHARFVDEYLIDLNGAKAAIRAGYSADNARYIAYQLLQRPEVSAAVADALAARAERTQIDADWVLRRLVDEAEADIADLYGPDGGLKAVKDWPMIWRKGLVAGMDVEEVHADGVVVATIRKIKVSDRIKRIELIGKHVNVQAFRERVEHTGKDGGPIEMAATLNLSRLTDEQLRALASIPIQGE